MVISGKLSFQLIIFSSFGLLALLRVLYGFILSVAKGWRRTVPLPLAPTIFLDLFSICKKLILFTLFFLFIIFNYSHSTRFDTKRKIFNVNVDDSQVENPVICTFPDSFVSNETCKDALYHGETGYEKTERNVTLIVLVSSFLYLVLVSSLRNVWYILLWLNIFLFQNYVSVQSSYILKTLLESIIFYNIDEFFLWLLCCKYILVIQYIKLSLFCLIFNFSNYSISLILLNGKTSFQFIISSSFGLLTLLRVLYAGFWPLVIVAKNTFLIFFCTKIIL